MRTAHSSGFFRRIVPPLLVLTGLVVFAGWMLFSREELAVPPPETMATNTVTINGQMINVSIARTEDEQAQGLSGRAPLASNEGMLFLFDKPDRIGFWMKDMNFSIDMIWIGPDRRILYIVPNAAPETYPHVFVPPAPSAVVLEVAANMASRLGWKPGDEVIFGEGILASNSN